MSRGARAAQPGGPSLPDVATPSLSAGYLAALPLFLAYELGLLLGASELRASAERVIALGLAFLDPRLQVVRLALLGGFACLAWLRLERRRGPAVGLVRLVGEGVLAGFLLAPVLVWLQGWLWAEELHAAVQPARSLATTLRLLGAAPWEELLFRVGLYAGLYLCVRRALAFLGLEPRVAGLAAEFAALLGSALGFAWFHLESAQHLLGARGEPFHAGLFLWRLSAGLLLAGLFRWRGFGVAAWAHALFNLGIALGLAP